MATVTQLTVQYAMWFDRRPISPRLGRAITIFVVIAIVVVVVLLLLQVGHGRLAGYLIGVPIGSVMNAVRRDAGTAVAGVGMGS